MFIAVDLPDPLGPMIATNSPAAMSRSIPFKAINSAWPLPYTLVTPRRRISGVPEVGRSAPLGDAALISPPPFSGR